MIGPITKMIPTWNTFSASSRAVAIWAAKRSCSSSSLTTPSPFVSAASSAENWSSSSCQVGIRIGHSFSSDRSDEVVDVLLEVVAELGPLLGQVVVLAGGQRRDEQHDEHREADHREVGERRCRALAGCGGPAGG